MTPPAIPNPAKTPVIPQLVKVAKVEPATTFPIPACTPAATEPAAMPEEVKPAAVNPAPTDATPAPVAAVPIKAFSVLL